MYQADCLLCLCQPSRKQSHLGVVGKRCRTLLSPYKSANERNKYALLSERQSCLTNEYKCSYPRVAHIHAMALIHTVTKGIGFTEVSIHGWSRKCFLGSGMLLYEDIAVLLSTCSCIHIANINFMFRGRLLCHYNTFYTKIKAQKGFVKTCHFYQFRLQESFGSHWLSGVRRVTCSWASCNQRSHNNYISCWYT